jgi:hypothetical protein
LRSLSSGAAARVLGVDDKLLDNILARQAKTFLRDGRRGRGRQIDFATLERIAIALILNRDLDVPVTRGLLLADEILRSPTEVELSVGPLTALRFDIARLRVSLSAAIAETLEEFIAPRRGRPPRA